MNEFFQEINIIKYLTLAFDIWHSTNGSKEIIKKYEELGSKIRVLIRSITKNLHSYDEKYMEIKLYLNDNLTLNKTIEIYNLTIVLRDVFTKITYKFS